MEITRLADEFLEIGRKRKELEERESMLRKELEEYFRATGTKGVKTSQGKVSFVEATSVEYDVEILKGIVPPSLYATILKVTANARVIEGLVKGGVLADSLLAPARRETVHYRIVGRMD
ncbi:MAG: hypothetical protein M1379_04315 [Firmicutes bacterium]|nr:hypothetical protein [Bacillota bacterium]